MDGIWEISDLLGVNFPTESVLSDLSSDLEMSNLPGDFTSWLPQIPKGCLLKLKQLAKDVDNTEYKETAAQECGILFRK